MHGWLEVGGKGMCGGSDDGVDVWVSGGVDGAWMGRWGSSYNK